MQAIAAPTQTPQSPNFLTQDNAPHPAHFFCGRKCRTKYTYDYGQRWVRKTLDTDADGTIEESQVFVHDNGQIVLDFQKTGTVDAGNSDLAHRYLWGGSVDDLLADETVDDGTADDVAWALTDHLGSVRDIVVYDPVTQTVSVVKHVVYDAYGNITSDTATGVESLFLYTARPFDPDTVLQNNLNRWYDATTGRWLSMDPIGFEAGDVNLYRYVGNGPVVWIDPTGFVDESLFHKFDQVFRSDLEVLPCGNKYMMVFLGSNVYEESDWRLRTKEILDKLKQYEPDANIYNYRQFMDFDGSGVRLHTHPGVTAWAFDCRLTVKSHGDCCFSIEAAVGGVLARVVLPDNDSFFRDHPDITPAMTLEHERNHFESWQTAYNIVVDGLYYVETKSFSSRENAEAYKQLAENEVWRIIRAVNERVLPASLHESFDGVWYRWLSRRGFVEDGQWVRGRNAGCRWSLRTFDAGSKLGVGGERHEHGFRVRCGRRR